MVQKQAISSKVDICVFLIDVSLQGFLEALRVAPCHWNNFVFVLCVKF